MQLSFKRSAWCLDEEDEKQKEPQPKKLGLLKKKKPKIAQLIPNIDLKHVINIGDMAFINEKSLRNPESSEETILRTISYYKTIYKVTLNDHFVNLDLKKNGENALPLTYFIERLRSYGDQDLARIADHMDMMQMQFSEVKAEQEVPQQTTPKFEDNFQNQLLHDFLEKMKDRNIIVYYSKITPTSIKLTNLIFTNKLLELLGITRQDISVNFIKHKHVFFEVFTSKNYPKFIEKCMRNIVLIQQETLRNKDITEEQILKMASMRHTEEVIRVREIDGVACEELMKATVNFFCPHPSICCVEIEKVWQDPMYTQIRKKAHLVAEEGDTSHEERPMFKIQENQPSTDCQSDSSPKFGSIFNKTTQIDNFSEEKAVREKCVQHSQMEKQNLEETPFIQ